MKRNLLNSILCGVIFLISLPKTLYFNFHYFDIRTAVRIPVIVHFRVKLNRTEGVVLISEKIKTAGIKMGFGHPIGGVALFAQTGGYGVLLEQ